MELIFKNMRLAWSTALVFKGQTSPNPPVGAVITDKDGKVIAYAAHEKAGELHAEAKALKELRDSGRIGEAHTMYVTLEPCNHTGKTAPCVKDILDSPIQIVVIGARDPNPMASGGAEILRAAGRTIVMPEIWAIDEKNKRVQGACEYMIAPFSKWVKTKMPYVIVKTAHLTGVPAALSAESMTPPVGHNTFTSEESLVAVHQLRKESDAIFTTGRTVHADKPQFTVRNVADFDGKKRYLRIFDRSGIVHESYLEKAERRGFDVAIANSFEDELRKLGAAGCHQVLVEAGPRFSEYVLQTPLWDRHLMIVQSHPADEFRWTDRH